LLLSSEILSDVVVDAVSLTIGELPAPADEYKLLDEKYNGNI
jgi:hypothetical protein